MVQSDHGAVARAVGIVHHLADGVEHADVAQALSFDGEAIVGRVGIDSHFVGIHFADTVGVVRSMQIEHILVILSVGRSRNALVQVLISSIKLVVVVTLLVSRVIGVAGSVGTQQFDALVLAILTKLSEEVVTRKAF